MSASAADPAQQMIGWDMILKAEVVEKPPLITQKPSHHRRILLQISSRTESRHQRFGKNDFINGIGQHRKSGASLRQVR